MVRILGASLVCSLLLGGCAGVPAGTTIASASPSSEPISTATAGPSPIQSAAPAPSPTLPQESPDPDSGRTWVAACVPSDALAHVLLWNVASTSTGLVAVGHLPVELPSGEPGARAIWTSEDGRRWERSTLPTEGPQAALAVVAQGSRVVVGGETGEVEGAIVWTRDATTEWTRIQLASAGAIRGAVVATQGFVLVGESPRGRPAIWHSPDGLDWERVGPDPDAGPHGVFSDVVATGAGFIAFGQIRASFIPGGVTEYPLPEEGRFDAVPWTSTDGVTWQPITDRSPFAWAHVSAISSGPRGLTAVGWVQDPESGDRTAATWTSTNGQSWTRVAFAGARVPTHFDIAATDRSGRIAAFARRDGAGGAWFGTWWTSDDGMTWTEAAEDPLFQDVSVDAVTGFGEGFVAVGLARGSACPIWLSPGR